MEVTSNNESYMIAGSIITMIATVLLPSIRQTICAIIIALKSGKTNDTDKKVQ